MMNQRDMAYTRGWRLRRDGVMECPEAPWEAIGWRDADYAASIGRPIAWSRGTDGQAAEMYPAAASGNAPGRGGAA